MTYFSKSVGIYGQAKQFMPIGQQRVWQAAAFKIFWNQRIVGGLDGVLHRQVQASRCFSTARYANKDDIGFLKPVDELSIVVGQREIDGFDALAVVFAGAAGVRTPDGVAGLHAQGIFNRRYEGSKKVQERAICFTDTLYAFAVDERTENEGCLAGFLCTAIDTSRHGRRFFDAVDEGQTYRFEFDLIKLGKYRMTESFCGDAGAVGNDKDSMFYFWGVHESLCAHRAQETVQSQGYQSRDA